ncbi:Cyclic di-GMP phosphodiesterase response regulator RpfG [bacterium HR14]|nr:Cyclic di-GMP phosphodiesterase response regulator RpfG [bacterium HR14]
MRRWRWTLEGFCRALFVGCVGWSALASGSELMGVLTAALGLSAAGLSRIRSERVRSHTGSLWAMWWLFGGAITALSSQPQWTWWVGVLAGVGVSWSGGSPLWRVLGSATALAGNGVPPSALNALIEYSVRCLLALGAVLGVRAASATPKAESEAVSSGFEPISVDNLPHSRALTQRLSIYLQQHLGHVQAEAAVLYLYDLRAGTLEPILRLGALPDLVKNRGRVLMGDGMVGVCASSGKPIAFLSLLKPPPDLPKSVAWEGAPSLCVPLFDPASPSGRPMGVLQLIGAHLTMDALPKARALASRIAEALAAARQREAEQLANFQRLSAIVAQVEEQSPHTRGHSHRVAALCDLLSQELGLESEVREKLRIAALFHDIGKTRIPPEILNKEGKLTDEERMIVRRYPLYSVEICAGMGFDEDVLFLIRHHGERLDGSGYPEGLDATRQPLALRILAVADVFDAMACTRSYRDALTTEARLRELSKMAGTKLDILVVETLRRCHLQGRVEPLYNELVSHSFSAGMPLAA